MDVAIAKARRCFFAYGAMGAYHGRLNPLSGRAIFETCVLPILLYGCENWFVNDAVLKKLDSFLFEIGHRIIRLSHNHSNQSSAPGSGLAIDGSKSPFKKVTFFATLTVK